MLGESLKHHVKEEEGTMFPEAETADLDWEALARKAMARKEALMAKKGATEKRRGRRSVKAGIKHLRKAA